MTLSSFLLVLLHVQIPHLNKYFYVFVYTKLSSLMAKCWPHRGQVSEFSLAGTEGMLQLPIDDYLVNISGVTVLSNFLSWELAMTSCLT